MDNNNRRWIVAAIIFLLAITIAVLFAVNQSASQGTPSTADTPTFTPEPILPTRTPGYNGESYPSQEQASALATIEPAAVPSASNTPAPLPTTTPSPTPAPTKEVESPAAATDEPRVSFVTPELARFGISIAQSLPDVEVAYAEGLPFGSALNWNVVTQPPRGPVEFWQMVRTDQQGIRRVTWDSLAEAVAANPAANWLIGNEPDVQWQDNVTPDRYAEIYHEVYGFIKERDPAAKVAIGGVSQPTPLRRAYLDIVLDTYEATYGEPMPIDIWNVHAFVLREEADSWGVGIPPGMEGETGILYEIDDHDDIEILAQNLSDFRKWMVERGYGDKPLVISEYGILMPEDYGFPIERMSTFLTASFDLFREMSGEEGLAADGNRLVQWWFWYSMNDDLLYPTGNLLDHDSGQLTELGEVWASYVAENAISP